MKWQPIETAPKDGTLIVGFFDKKMAVVSWRRFGGSSFWELCVCGDQAESSEWFPTHWLSLPAPPKDGPCVDGKF